MLRRLALPLFCLGILLVPVTRPLHAGSSSLGQSQSKTRIAKTQKANTRKLVKHEADDAAKRSAQLDSYFGICDLDDSSWISFREASATMGVTKADFRALDSDDDGRFERSEFDTHSSRVIDLLGAFPDALPRATEKTPKPNLKPKQDTTPSPLVGTSNNPFADALAAGAAGSEGNLDLKQLLASEPARNGSSTEQAAASEEPPKPRMPRIPYPSPREMLILFDRDKSGGLSRKEIKVVLARVHAKLSADVIVDRTDRNQNNELESRELGPLSFIISRRLPPEGFLSRANPGASGASQLQWGRQNSELAKPLNGLANAEQFSHFKRLDSNGDGKIDSADLRTKLTQSHSSVRASAIISALDSDGDGSIDPEEFTVALRGGN